MRGIEGKIEAIRYARTRGIPFFGICLGMQCAAVEFARSVLGLDDANSTEFDKHTQHPVISLMEDQSRVRQRGGTMRLGAWPCDLAPGSLARAGLRRRRISERHRHRYEFNNDYRKRFAETRASSPTGLSPDGSLVEIIELPDHPWFLAVQFHPEFKSKPTKAHPLFRDFIAAALRPPRGERRAGAREPGTRVRRWSECGRSHPPIAESRPMEPDRLPATSRPANGSACRSRAARSPRSRRPTGPAAVSADDDWVAPAFWDIQPTAAGASRSPTPTLTADQVAEIVRAQAALGTARLCPTLITAPFDVVPPRRSNDRRGVRGRPRRRLAWSWASTSKGRTSRRSTATAAPTRSTPSATPTGTSSRRFQDAAEGRIVLMTLAPERPGAIEFIRKAVASRRGDRAGPHRRRRPDPPRRRRRRRDAEHAPGQRDRLAPAPPPEPDLGTGRARRPRAPRSSPTATTSTRRRSRSSSAPRRPRGRSSSATPARSPASRPGRTGRWAVHPSGKIVVAGTPYLAGSNQGLEVGLNTPDRRHRPRPRRALATVTAHPARLLGPPRAVALRRPAREPRPLPSTDRRRRPFRLLRTCVDGLDRGPRRRPEPLAGGTERASRVDSEPVVTDA